MRQWQTSQSGCRIKQMDLTMFLHPKLILINQNLRIVGGKKTLHVEQETNSNEHLAIKLLLSP